MPKSALMTEVIKQGLALETSSSVTLPAPTTGATRPTIVAHRDNLRRVIQSVDANLQSSFTQYDASSRVTKTIDREGNETAFSHVPFGVDVVKTVDPVTGTITSASAEYTTGYDNFGRTVSQTDALGRITAYAYDYLGQLARVTLPDADTTDSIPAPTLE